MAKHSSSNSGAAKHAASSDSTYIGRHRERTDVQDDPQGFSVGRGVAEQPEHRRNS